MTSGDVAIAVVVIGRNEGLRLQACLASIVSHADVGVVVYVDSGSTDSSVANAMALGCHVVSLDLSTPFTAARARNEGFAKALHMLPRAEYVQFIDGDCEIAPGWLNAATEFLQVHRDFAAACGRRRERFPQNSIYNQLCDIEWATPIGDTKSCGGDVLMRVKPLLNAGGYRNDLIAGEEPELCFRLRSAGWKIRRLDHEMTLHDAAILRFRQWWSRSKRAGYAFAQGAALHGSSPERHWVRETRSAVLWGICFPVGIAMLSAYTSLWAMSLLFVYPLQVLRIYFNSRHQVPFAGWYAYFLVLGKFAEAQGVVKSSALRFFGKNAKLIEYK